MVMSIILFYCIIFAADFFYSLFTNYMKKVFLLTVLSLMISVLSAQNLQLHYDFGKDRNYLTSTLEMFKPDKWGSTFVFVDLDYDVGEIKGVSLAYFEIARSFNLRESPLAAHLEYNGGFGQYYAGEYFGAFQIDDAWLAGLDYNLNNEDFTRGITFQVLYKYIREKHDVSFQLTAVWYMHMYHKKMTFTGFADFWREDMYFADGIDISKTDFIFMAEPQLWYNFTENVSVGSEIEVGYNFGGIKGFRVNPTLGAKWTF